MRTVAFFKIVGSLIRIGIDPVSFDKLNKRGQKRRIITLAFLCLFALIMVSCPPINNVSENVGNISELLNRALNMLPNLSGDFIATLRETRDKLIAEGQSTLANEVDRIIDAAIAHAGGNLRCNVDFFVRRVRQGLEDILEAFQTNSASVKSPPPVICEWVDPVINLNLAPTRRTKLEFWGYDLDHRDSNNIGLKLYLVTESLSFSDLTRFGDLTTRGGISTIIGAGKSLREQRQDVSRHLHINTHYSATVNISGSGINAETANASRIILTWADEVLSSIPILKPIPPEERQVSVNIAGDITYTPIHTAGDGDFDGKAVIEAMATIDKHPTDPRKLIARIYMKATEPGGDGTVAEGWSDAGPRLSNDPRFIVWEAPSGYNIVEIVNPKPNYDTFKFTDNDHNVDVFQPNGMTSYIDAMARSISIALRMTYDQAKNYVASRFTYSNNGLVNKWEFVGDTAGSEAGSRTLVRAMFNPVNVKIRRAY